MFSIRVKQIGLALLCCTFLHLVTSETSNEDHRNNIQGLFYNILSSSSQGQANINIGRNNGEQSTTSRAITSPRPASNRSDSESRSAASRLLTPNITTEAVPDYDDSSEMVIPEPQRLGPDIRTRVIDVREREKSHADAKEIRIEQIKSTLLRKLRLERLPSPRLVESYLRFPHHILQGLNNDGLQNDEPKKEDNYHAKINQLIRFAQQGKQASRKKFSAIKVDLSIFY